MTKAHKILIGFFLVGYPVFAQAYVDPSVMSYTVQAIAGVVIGMAVIFGVVWRRFKKGTKKLLNIDENANKEVEEEIKITSDEEK